MTNLPKNYFKMDVRRTIWVDRKNINFAQSYKEQEIVMSNDRPRLERTRPIKV